MKINRQNAGWIFTCVLLGALLLLSVYLGLSGWYFKNQTSSYTHFQLGKTTQLEVDGNEANAFSVVMEGSFLPQEQLPQVVAIKNSSQDKAIYLRAKVMVDSSWVGEGLLQITSTANWTFNQDDGYYYYIDTLPAQNKVGLCSHIITPQDNVHASGDNYIITFLVESLDEGQDIVSLWGEVPILN